MLFLFIFSKETVAMNYVCTVQGTPRIRDNAVSCSKRRWHSFRYSSSEFHLLCCETNLFFMDETS